ncbi:sensor histidine kinase [Desulfonatronovibrio hydrogenovorans]|uniref:sensor histidine kinase n=1 Tax=Desulfonatronovibrio hydrogenovorans TaxID=53245 RepID=UPI00068D3337|nr:PAS domain-containing sensor histidine kinase [Desulfonatronovibrio hydrogenovorans]
MSQLKASIFSGHILSEYLLQESAVLILVLDSQGLIVEANNYALNIVGQDIKGKDFNQVIVDFSENFNFQKIMAENNQTHLLNISSYTGLPQTFYFRFLKHGDKIIAVGELNHLEIESLRKSLIDLNNEFSNLNRELQKKNAELSKLNQLKNHLLGMAAHDLRNPIGAIDSLSEFLLEEAGPELTQEHIQFLQAIQSSSRFMLNLLDDLLDVAKIEAGRLDLNIQSADLAALTRSWIALNQVMAQKKKIRIDLHQDESLPLVPLDSMKIEQVMNNLLSNAVKFSPSGTVVKVSVFLNSEQVTVAVSDQGPGIPKDDLKKIFQPFTKTSVALPEGEKSTGLGLAIVQKIIKGHKGKIWVESEPGKGSTFYISLPLTDKNKDGVHEK